MKKPVMLDYIHETRQYAARVLDNSAKNCERFAAQYAARKYKRILIAASGTSCNACITARPFMEKVLGVPVTVFTAYDFAHYDKVIHRDEDLLITLTQEGESTNTLDCIRKADQLSLDNWIVTEDRDSTGTNMAGGRVIIDCGREYVGPKTKGYTCSVLTLYVMALEAGKAAGSITDAQYADYMARARRTVDNIDNVIERSKAWFEHNKEQLVPCERCYMISYGANVGTVLEGALKSLETVRYTFFSFELEEFLHGPIASVKKDVYLLLVSPRGEGYQRANTLYKFLDQHHPNTFGVGAQDGVDSPKVLDGGFMDDEDFSPLEYGIPLQLFAYLLYTAKGIDLEVREYPRPGDALSTKAQKLERPQG